MSIQKAEKLILDFNKATGIKIALFDSRFHVLCSAEGDGLDVCSYIHGSKRCLELCMQSDLSALKRARETKKPCVYTCPFGFCEITAPIFDDEGICAYLIASLGFKGTEPQTIIEKINETASETVGEELLQRCKKELCCDGEKLDALQGIITVLTSYLSAEKLCVSEGETLGALTKRYIRNNLSKKITLASLSLNLHCSTVTLTEHFKREFGITIVQYITQKRIEAAEKLLRETNISIKEISGRCGFSDSEYFSKCFKKEKGISPLAFRTKQQETPVV